MLQLLDTFFFVAHAGLIGFNLVGWIHPRTRPFQLVTLLATAFSWFVGGLWVGRIGYCVCTDWHFQVRRELGINDPPDFDYIQLLVLKLTGISLEKETSWWLSALTFLGIVLATTLVRLVPGRRPEKLSSADDDSRERPTGGE